jgi:hypothetical protein
MISTVPTPQFTQHVQVVSAKSSPCRDQRLHKLTSVLRLLSDYKSLFTIFCLVYHANARDVSFDGLEQQVLDQMDVDNKYALWPADKLEYSSVGLDVG